MKRFVFLFMVLACSSLGVVGGSESYKGYKGFVDCSAGIAYNPSDAQKISTNNMQIYGEITTTQGYYVRNWFVGLGIGYYHSYRDKENMYPFYLAGRYTFNKAKIKPYIEARAGIMYDPYWIEKVQKYGALSIGIKVYKGFQVGLRGSVFSRPSRYFTANAAVVLSYAIGK